jgi:hypothetical protein
MNHHQLLTVLVLVPWMAPSAFAKPNLNTGDAFYRCSVAFIAGSNLANSNVKFVLSDSAGNNVAHHALAVKNTTPNSASYSKLLHDSRGEFNLPNPGLLGAGPLATVVYNQSNDSGLDLSVYSLRDPRIVINGKFLSGDRRQFSIPNHYAGDLSGALEGVRVQLQYAFGFREINRDSFLPALQESFEDFNNRATSVAGIKSEELLLSLVRRQDTLLLNALEDLKLVFTDDRHAPLNTLWRVDYDNLAVDLQVEVHKTSTGQTYVSRFRAKGFVCDHFLDRLPTPKSKYQAPYASAARDEMSVESQKNLLNRLIERS